MYKMCECKLDDSLDFKLVKVVGKLRNQMGRQLRHLDITSEQWGILARLWEQDGLNQRELAEKNLKDQANLTRILDKVVNKGWVQRVDALDDRRAYLIYLTDEGKRIVQATYPLVAHVKEKLTQGLTGDEIQAFVTIIDKISQNMD
jgi:DNA-binding MarR family transcriptional regulator